MQLEISPRGNDGHRDRLKRIAQPLSVRLWGESGAGRTFAIPRRSPGDAAIAVSQEPMLFFDRLGYGQAYHVSSASEIIGPLDVRRLQQAIDQLVDRHESLRTGFHEGPAGPLARVAGSARLVLVQLDLCEQPPTDAGLQAILRESARRPFDLRQPPLIRATLLRIAADRHILFLTIHHIIQDGSSRGIFFRELAAVYRGLVSGERVTLEPLPIQFGDFADWQRALFAGDALDKQRAFWHAELGGELPYLQLPADRPRPREKSYRGASHWILVRPEVVAALRAIAREHDASLFMTLMAAFTLLLHRYTNQDDFLVGFPGAGRPLDETLGVFGCFVNTLVLHSRAPGDPSFVEHLERIRSTARRVYDNQDFPFARLVADLAPARSLSRAPLLSVMATLLVPSRPTLVIEGAQVHRVRFDHGHAILDLLLEMGELPDGLECRFEYATDLFDNARIVAVAECFRRVLESVAADPQSRLSALPVPSDGERRLLADP